MQINGSGLDLMSTAVIVTLTVSARGHLENTEIDNLFD